MNDKHSSRRSKLDSNVLFDIKKYLTKHYTIRSWQIKIEHIIIFKKTRLVLKEPLSDIEISNLTTKYPIRIPDLTILDTEKKIWFVIEQDGKSHESKKRKQKDKIRNQHYKKKNIPLIVLSTRKLKSEKKAWYDDLDDQMEQNGLIDSDD